MNCPTSLIEQSRPVVLASLVVIDIILARSIPTYIYSQVFRPSSSSMKIISLIKLCRYFGWDTRIGYLVNFGSLPIYLMSFFLNGYSLVATHLLFVLLLTSIVSSFASCFILSDLIKNRHRLVTCDLSWPTGHSKSELSSTSYQ